MGKPTLKKPEGSVVWSSTDPDQTVFVTQEHDQRYYIWVRDPKMIPYGYTTGYAWRFSDASKSAAVKRARQELSSATKLSSHHATKKSAEHAHEHDPVGHARGVRAREIVRLAAEQVKDPSTRYWLLADERGTFEKAARKYLEETADKARALGMPNAKVNEEIAVMLALSAVEAFLKRARKGR